MQLAGIQRDRCSRQKAQRNDQPHPEPARFFFCCPTKAGVQAHSHNRTCHVSQERAYPCSKTIHASLPSNHARTHTSRANVGLGATLPHLASPDAWRQQGPMQPPTSTQSRKSDFGTSSLAAHAQRLGVSVGEPAPGGGRHGAAEGGGVHPAPPGHCEPWTACCAGNCARPSPEPAS